MSDRKQERGAVVVDFDESRSSLRALERPLRQAESTGSRLVAVRARQAL
ncbi:hypothetical protein L0U85_18690 [Glycomyces sp. L485]|nr:hypothetical protein [Glycomyces sp. L485]MCH7232865.1 hypothetical protein [Glycomyces sp. L485]